MTSAFRTSVLALLAAWAIVGVGCGSTSRSEAVPFELQNEAVLPGFDHRIRAWGGDPNPDFLKALADTIPREQAALAAAGYTGAMPRADYLAISGGGSNGAFGAGLLCGWSDLGTRPTFKLITGISTGALIAPFVFAGPEYDRVLRDVYTTTKTSDILTDRGFLAAVFDDALSDTRPLWKTLSKNVDQKLVDAIAREHDKGRVLIIGTTNLDARRAVLWNIGEIAASGNPKSVDILRRIMVASAAIPAAFPPVFFETEAGGKTFQEMHVDGGAMTQVFLYPPTIRMREDTAKAGFARDRRAYIIRNARLDPDWASTTRQTLPIAMRTIDSLIHTQGVGDLYRIYATAQRDEVDFNLAFIPPTFKEQSKEPFDPVYMTKLFQLGYDMATKGYPWDKVPPGFAALSGASEPTSK